jgi:crossover junction endodeoxyribonuclease RuvC
MIILGLDPGTARLGWGVIDTGKANRSDAATCIAYGCIETDKTMNDSLRLLAIAQGLRKLIADYSPTLVGVEKLFFSNNQKTAMTVSQARGVVLLLLEEAAIPLLEFTPQQVKQGLTGYGKAEKTQIQKMVKLLLNLSELPKPDDAADALAIAITSAQVWETSQLY